MLYCLGLTPFKDYWIDCMYNTLFSVLISRDPSYRFAPFLNNYSYQILKKKIPTGTVVDYLRLYSVKDVEEVLGRKYHFDQQPINFRQDSHFVEYLQGLVREGNLVTIGVDLFYWIPNSVCWNKHHWDHYCLIHGFDDEQRLFYVFDENILGFDEYEIPEARVRQAIQSSPVQPHGYLNQITDIEPFEFSVADVVTYADQLARELAEIDTDTLWRLSEEDFAGRHMCDLFSMHIFQIVNRQRANQVLFEVLQSQKMIPNPELMDRFIQSCQELQNGWTYVKGKFIRTYAISDRERSISDIRKKCKYLFGKEYDMWSGFRDSFG